MVTIYVGGKAVKWADAEKLFAETACTQSVEFRDDAGRVIATSAPAAEADPDWVKAITPEAIRQALEGPFLTLEEYRKQTGSRDLHRRMEVRRVAGRHATGADGG